MRINESTRKANELICFSHPRSLSLRGVGSGGWSAYSITSGSIAIQRELDGLTSDDAGAGAEVSVQTKFGSFHGTAKGAFERSYTVSVRESFSFNFFLGVRTGQVTVLCWKAPRLRYKVPYRCRKEAFRKEAAVPYGFTFHLHPNPNLTSIVAPHL